MLELQEVQPLFKIVESISVDSATAGSVSAGSIASQTFAIASSLMEQLMFLKLHRHPMLLPL